MKQPPADRPNSLTEQDSCLPKPANSITDLLGEPFSPADDGTTDSPTVDPENHGENHGDASRERVSRRRLIQALAAAGVGGGVFHRALAAQVEKEPQTPTAEMIEQAEWISGISLTEQQRAQAAATVTRNLRKVKKIRDLEIDFSVAPAVALHVTTNPPPATAPVRTVRPVEWSSAQKPQADEDLAFLPVCELSALVRTRQVSSRELTRLYLDRLQKYNPALNCIVNLTESVALKQADRADREIAAGRYRGPLHGIPWGAKDLIAHPDAKTTWGSKHFRERTLKAKATVAERLEQAGAVMVAKLSLGTFAWGDRWFNGITRNPWNLSEGSSGSSAGSAAATAAGLVGFSLGSETLGSIVSPSRRCGASGLRPTFGRVSRYGCMTLAWSFDKIGPICRSVEDCALVLAAIHGSDGRDPTVIDAPYQWPPSRPLHTLRVGYLESEGPIEKRSELQTLQELGLQLKPIKLPHDFPVWEMTMILDTEAAAVFDTFTKAGEVEGINRWPPVFQAAQFTTAIDYLQAQRARTLLMQRMESVFADVDMYVNGNDLGITNLSGHPTVVMPRGMIRRRGKLAPGNVTLTGRLYGEEDLLAVARALQLATGDHLKRPTDFLQETESKPPSPKPSPKPDSPKPDSPKPDSPKQDRPKQDRPKQDAGKPKK